MDFLIKRGLSLQKRPPEKFSFLPALMILFGTSIAFAIDFSGPAEAYISSYSECICVLALILILLCGFSLFGNVIVCILDLLLGAFLSVGMLIKHANPELFSLSWFLWAIEIFALIFCALLISGHSIKLSRELFKRICSDRRFNSKLFKFCVTSVCIILLFISVLFALIRIRTDLLNI